jgi:hypothetical protein
VTAREQAPAAGPTPAAAFERELAFMADLGTAAEVSQVWISYNFTGDDGELYSYQIAEWDADGVPSQQEDPQLAGCPYETGGFGRWRLSSLGTRGPPPGDLRIA